MPESLPLPVVTTDAAVLPDVLDACTSEASYPALGGDALRQALDAHAIVSVTDAHGVITSVNDLFCTVSGYSRQELVGRTHRVVNAGLHPAEFWAEMWATLKRGALWRGEVCNRAKDGSLFWVDSTIFPLPGADGRPSQFVSVRTDITGQKKAEQELVEARQEALRDARWRVTLSAMSADVALAANTDGPLCGMLTECTRAVARHLRAHGVWIWTAARQATPVASTGRRMPDPSCIGVVDRLYEPLPGDGPARTQRAVFNHGLPAGTLFAAIPLLSGDAVLGVLAVETAQALETHTRDTLQMLTSSIALGIERNRAAAALREAASYDALTQLPNRTMLTARLRELFERKDLQEAPTYAVLFIDLDNFKYVNDSLGHEAGDELLVETGRRLASVVRAGDSLARAPLGMASRFGGDEFVVVLDRIGRPEHALTVARRILDAMARPFAIGGQSVTVQCSIGISTSERRYTSVEDVLRDADTALYQAKAAGKGHCVLFDESMHLKARWRLKMENDLRTAVLEQRLRCVYQPIVDLTTGKVTAFEALVRWEHPSEGNIPPDEFIPMAEETGLMVDLGRLILYEAADALKAFHTVNPEAAVMMNVNVSRRQLMDPGFCPMLRAVLADLGPLAGRLRLEITESAVTGSHDKTMAALTEVKRLGVEVHLDDFGTGLSSLGLLRELPVDGIKIDRTFMEMAGDDAQSVAIVSAIIALGHNLGKTVIAEGISESDQLVTVLALNCDAAQGYLLGRPLPLEFAAEALTRDLTALRLVGDVPAA